MSEINEKKDQLVNTVAKITSVWAIGQTGDLNEELIPGFSDINMFVLCAELQKIATKEIP